MAIARGFLAEPPLFSCHEPRLLAGELVVDNRLELFERVGTLQSAAVDDEAAGGGGEDRCWLRREPRPRRNGNDRGRGGAVEV